MQEPFTELPDSTDLLGSAATDQWWHYLIGVALVGAIALLAAVSLRVA